MDVALRCWWDMLSLKIETAFWAVAVPRRKCRRRREGYALQKKGQVEQSARDEQTIVLAQLRPAASSIKSQTSNPNQAHQIKMQGQGKSPSEKRPAYALAGPVPSSSVRTIFNLSEALPLFCGAWLASDYIAGCVAFISSIEDH